jgi:transposase
VLLETTVEASSGGYVRAVQFARAHAPGRRVFAIEGTGSFCAGLARFLSSECERVLEVGRLRRERRSGGKTDALDAVRAARSVLARSHLAEPRPRSQKDAKMTA